MFGAGNQYKGILGVAQKMLAKQEQEQYRASANVGDPWIKPQATGPGTPSQTFSKRSCAKGEDIYGSEPQRAMSMQTVDNQVNNIEGPLVMENSENK
tara:strand:- start:132 stop:422 length:291 start_codon:yes stop_codon:yes gene_type:complete